MSDEQQLPVLPPDATLSWLARNRKLVILVGVALVLVGIAAVTYVLPRRQTAQLENSATTITNISVVTNEAATNGTTRPTFQRSTIANVSTSPPPAYQPPTAQQLKQAIDQLNSATNQSP